MALNLVRNSRLFFTTNVNATTGVVTDGSHTSSTTFEIQVLDGFSFSQNTNNETVTVSEAGTAPVRGQRSFNTSLAPVDFSFSTYIRPKLSTDVVCEESVLWNAFFGTDAQNTAATFTGMTGATYSSTTGELTVTGAAMTALTVGDKYLINGITSSTVTDVRVVNGPATVKSYSATSIVFTMDNQFNTVSATPGTAGTLTVTNMKLYTSAWGKAVGASGGASMVAAHASNKNQLQKFGLLMIVDGVSYAIDNCAMNEATIDFGLDGIATIAWTGQATALRQLANNITTVTAGTFGGGTITGSYTQKTTDANYITNKLSTCKLKTAAALGGGTVGTGYYLALTGGSLTISNNITYITPAILGVVNTAITYYTGTRSITGTLNAYLNTGTISTSLDGTTYTKGTGELVKDMLAASSTATEPMFAIELAVGGVGNTTKVELAMPSVSIGVPAINAEQVVSTAITFTAAPSTGPYGTRTYDLAQTNELTVRYYSA
jgi:hypothetical protein